MREKRKNHKQELEQYKERLSIALNAARICIFEVDLTKQLYTFFENAEAIFGVSGDVILKDVQPYSRLDPEAYRLSVSEYFSHPEDTDVIEGAFVRILNGKPAVYEARMRAGGSGYIWCRINVTPIVENGKPVKMIGVITDISDVKEKTDSLKRAASLDHFTGLFNKAHTIDAIHDILNRDNHGRHALVLLDIDNFKSFNDTYGHDEGDKIIQMLSCLIKKSFRRTDIVGRFGGDEFLVLVKNAENEQWLRDKLSDLVQFDVDGFTCTNSIGVAFFPQDAEDFNDLFKKADKALYRAKDKKEDIVFCATLATP